MNAASTRKVVIVLGMHRSGTSALTRVLNLLGCAAPRTLMVPDVNNPSGYWESRPISDLNDRILESAGSHWADWQEVNPNWIHTPVADAFAREAAAVLEHEYGDSSLFVLKDPRICLLMPFWRSVIERAGIECVAVHTVRHPQEVAASLANRDGFHVARSLLVWLRYLLAAESGSRGLRRYFTSYDQVLNDVRSMVQKSEIALGCYWPRQSERVFHEVSEYLVGSLRHHSTGPASLSEPLYGTPWVRRAFDTFVSWVEMGEKCADYHLLDDLRSELTAAGAPFSRAILDLDFAVTEVKSLSAELTDAEQKRTEDIAELASRIDMREQQIAELEAQLAARSQVLDALQVERNSAQQRITALIAELTQTQEQMAAAETRQAADTERREQQLEADLAQRDKVINESKRDLAVFKDRIISLETLVKEKSDLIQDAEASLLKLRVAGQASSRDVAALSQEVASRNQALELAEQRLEEKVLALAQTRNELRQRQHEAEQTGLALAAVTHEFEKLKLAKKATDAQLQETHSLAEERETKLSNLRQAHLQLESKFRIQSDQIATLVRQVADAAYASNERQQQIAQLNDQLGNSASEIAELRVEILKGRDLFEQFDMLIETLLQLPQRRYLTRRKVLQRQIALLTQTGLFDAEWYNRNNADVAAKGVNPAVHFIRYGRKEGRAPSEAMACLQRGNLSPRST
jgi:hypothetical protein